MPYFGMSDEKAMTVRLLFEKTFVLGLKTCCI